MRAGGRERLGGGEMVGRFETGEGGRGEGRGVTAGDFGGGWEMVGVGGQI